MNLVANEFRIKNGLIIGSLSVNSGGTITAGTWEATDIAVAHGGTGASTLTDGGILLGNGTGAIQAMAVLDDGEMIVGDGTTDPSVESGATLRTSIGVGTGDSPQFTGIELGHANDTTIARASAGQITVEGTAVVLAGGANHDGFSDFVANEHIDHSGVSISAGSGLTGGGTIATNRTLTVGAGNGITVNTNDVAVTAAQTTITSVLNTGLVIGRDATDQIKFSTDDQIIFRVGNADGVIFKASGEIEATKFDGALEGNADTASVANRVVVVANDAAGSFVNENNLILFSPDGTSSNDGGNLTPESSTDFHYNPSTTILTVPKIAGDITGALTGNASGSAGTVTSIGNLTGDVTSNNRATTIANNAVTLAKMAGLARGKIIYGDSNGDPAALALGSNGQVLTTDGTDISWGDASGGIASLADDDSPQLGAALDTAGYDIVSTSNQHIDIAPHGTGDVRLQADTVQIGDSNADVKLTTNGTGDLTIDTNSGTNSGSIVIADGVNGNITLAPNGTGLVDIPTALEVGTGTQPLSTSGVVTIINDNVDTYPSTLLLMDNEDDATNGPLLTLYRNTASPLANDILGKIQLNGEDSGGNPRTYGSIRQESPDVSNGSHDGTMFLNVAINGTQTDVVSVDGTGGYGGLTHNPSGIKTLGNVVGATSTANNNYITLLEVPHATFKAVKASIHITDSSSNEVQTQETIAHYDGSNANYSNYGIIFDGAAAIGAIEVDINSSNIRIRFKNTQGATRDIAGSIHAVCHP